MDSASSPMICLSYASVSGPFYSSSLPFGSSKITKSTCQYNAMRYLYKVGRAEIHCSGCREKKDPYPRLPTLKPLAISSISHGESQRFKVYAFRSPKGFGPPPAKRTKKKKKKKRMLEDEEEEEEEDDEDEEQEPEDAVIPEIVTNRMIKRIGASVGLPLAIGLTFFPLFYYMKVVLKWSVPDWLPFITSFLTFGSAALGITYGIMSTSWDPLREGSFSVGPKPRRIGQSFGRPYGKGKSNRLYQLLCFQKLKIFIRKLNDRLLDTAGVSTKSIYLVEKHPRFENSHKASMLLVQYLGCIAPNKICPLLWHKKEAHSVNAIEKFLKGICDCLGHGEPNMLYYKMNLDWEFNSVGLKFYVQNIP